MGTPIEEAAEGWKQLADWSLTSWPAQVEKVATKARSGGYTADQAAADLIDTALLAGETALLIGNEVFDSIAVLSAPLDQPVLIETDTFPTAKQARVSRSLKLDGPLTSGLGHEIPAAAISLVPNPLPPYVTEFHIELDAAGLFGVGYIGTVGVWTTDTSARVDTVTVWVQVQ